MALVSLQDGGLTALARPISLKNRSIDLIADILPNAALSARSEDTVKGAVALLKPPTTSVERVAEPARPAWVIFPTVKLGAATELACRSQADTLIERGSYAFNYTGHGTRRFGTLPWLVAPCPLYHPTYGQLTETSAP